MTTTDDLQALIELAASLRPRRTAAKPLPRLLFVTDPQRTPDPEAIVRRLPAAVGVIYRSFGAPDAGPRAERLREITGERGMLLLVGDDNGLAQTCRADGTHLPERRIAQAPALRAVRPDWLITAAAHSLEAAERAAACGCDAVLVSPVFASNSPSAGAPMGAEAFAGLVAAAPLPVYALGGVNLRTARELRDSGAAGLAMVEEMARLATPRSGP